VLGTLLSHEAELRVMLAQGSGSIVNVSSTYGRTGRGRLPQLRASSTRSKGDQIRPLGRGVRGAGQLWSPPVRVETGMLNRFTGTDERRPA